MSASVVNKLRCDGLPIQWFHMSRLAQSHGDNSQSDCLCANHNIAHRNLPSITCDTERDPCWDWLGLAD